MSSALVRQALEFVDQDESAVKKTKGSHKRRATGQALPCWSPYGYTHTRPNKQVKVKQTVKTQSTEDKVNKLLALSQSVVDNIDTEKIISRAQSGKAVIKLESKEAEPQSILFADDPLPHPRPLPSPKRQGKGGKLPRRGDSPDADAEFESDPFCCT